MDKTLNQMVGCHLEGLTVMRTCRPVTVRIALPCFGNSCDRMLAKRLDACRDV